MIKLSLLYIPAALILLAMVAPGSAAAPARGPVMKKDSMAPHATPRSPHFVSYSDTAFMTTQKAKQPTIVAISASWCPVCKNQEIILSKLMTQPAYAKTAFFRVDFDKQKAVVEKFQAKSQSTIIAFNDGKEVSRLVYSADPAKLTELATKASAQ
jgi:thioredoxin-like negative regulator of GroEL